jgi:hypothetical protein
MHLIYDEKFLLSTVGLVALGIAAPASAAAPGRLACEPMDDDYLRELAFHEAGHAVVA